MRDLTIELRKFKEKVDPEKIAEMIKNQAQKTTTVESEVKSLKQMIENSQEFEKLKEMLMPINQKLSRLDKELEEELKSSKKDQTRQNLAPTELKKINEDLINTSNQVNIIKHKISTYEEDFENYITKIVIALKKLGQNVDINYRYQD